MNQNSKLNVAKFILIIIPVVLLLFFFSQRTLKYQIAKFTFSKVARSINYDGKIMIGIENIIYGKEASKFLSEISSLNKIQDKNMTYVGINVKFLNITQKEQDLYRIYFKLYLKTYLSEKRSFSPVELFKQNNSLSTYLLNKLEPLMENELRYGYIFFKIPTDSRILTFEISDMFHSKRFFINMPSLYLE